MSDRYQHADLNFIIGLRIASYAICLMSDLKGSGRFGTHLDDGGDKAAA